MRIVQSVMATGYGGLEMVAIEFHEWLLANQVDSYLICYENSPVHRETVRRQLDPSKTFTVKRNLFAPFRVARLRKQLDSVETSHLFHTQKGLRSLGFTKLKGPTSLIAHTFYGVEKKDFWHQYIFRKVTCWIALTSIQKQNMIEKLNIAEDKIAIIPNGVDWQSFKINDRPIANGKTEAVKIGVFSRLDPGKGQDTAIRALAKLRNIGLNCELHLVGEDTTDAKSLYSPLLRELASSLKIKRYVFFEGFRNTIAQDMAQYDFIWVPSKAETFGRCIIEAMAANVPVVASRAGGVPDIITHNKNGYLFESGNAIDLAMITYVAHVQRETLQQVRRQALHEAHTKFDKNRIWIGILKNISGHSQQVIDLENKYSLNTPFKLPAVV